MNLIPELRQRRVSQIVSGCAVAGRSARQFLAFLEGRVAVSANLLASALLLIFLTQDRGSGAVTQTIEAAGANREARARTAPKRELARGAHVPRFLTSTLAQRDTA